MTDVQKLIAEARAHVESVAARVPGKFSDEVRAGTRISLFVRLADALEAATSPVGEKQNRANPDLDLVLPPRVSLEPADQRVPDEVIEAGRHAAFVRAGSSYPPDHLVDTWRSIIEAAAPAIASWARETAAPPTGLGSGSGDREALAKVLCEADIPTLGYERRRPDYPGDDIWEGYLPHADAVLAAGFSRPVGGETVTEWEYGYRSKQTGNVWRSGSLGDAVMGAQVTDSIVVRRQAATAWSPVSPEQDGSHPPIEEYGYVCKASDISG